MSSEVQTSDNLLKFMEFTYFRLKKDVVSYLLSKVPEYVSLCEHLIQFIALHMCMVFQIYSTITCRDMLSSFDW